MTLAHYADGDLSYDEPERLLISPRRFGFPCYLFRLELE